MGDSLNGEGPGGVGGLGRPTPYRWGQHVINYVYAWRNRGMEDARRRIGTIVLSSSPRRTYTGVELRQRTELRRGVLYRTLERLVDAKWLGVDSAVMDGRRQNIYFITERGKHLFPSLLADHDIHSGDNVCRQVGSEDAR